MTWLTAIGALWFSFALASDVALPADTPDGSEVSPPAAVAEVPESHRPKLQFDGMVTPETPHFDLEVLYHQGRYDEGLKLARQRLAADPNDARLYMHVVRFMFEIGETFDRNDPTVDKKAYYTEMIQVAEAGRARFPDDMHLLFGYGIGKARLGTTRGVLSSLFMAKEIEQAWLRVVASGYRSSSLGGEEMIPCDTQLTLGIFYRMVPDWWIVKLLSGTRGDLDKSLAFLKDADACHPKRTGVVKELGVTQLCIGSQRSDAAMIEAGRATLRRVLALPIDSPTDTIDHRHAVMLIDDPSLACEYSRDGQQDLDEAALEATP